MRDFDLNEEIYADGCSSRYADPDADGIRPVFKTNKFVRLKLHSQQTVYLHVFLSSSGFRDRVGLSKVVDLGFSAGCNDDANTGGRVPPGGPLIRLLSAIANILNCSMGLLWWDGDVAKIWSFLLWSLGCLMRQTLANGASFHRSRT